MSYFPDIFLPFLEVNSNRFETLLAYIKYKELPYSIIQLGEHKHIQINFPSTVYDPTFRQKIVLAHYDCHPNTSGANDNGAAVYQLLLFAEELLQLKEVHNMRIIFTAGEEDGDDSGVKDQGAYVLAAYLKKIGLTSSDIYAIDCCGRGDELVISTAGKNKGAPKFKDIFDDFFERTEALVRRVSAGRWASFPVPYSDNAGFLAWGIPAIAITLLPQIEATDLMRNLLKIRTLEDALMNHKPYNKEHVPLTWRMIHSEFDTEASLTPESFSLMKKFLSALAQTKTLS